MNKHAQSLQHHSGTVQQRFCHCSSVVHAMTAFAAQASSAHCPSEKYEYIQRFEYPFECVTRRLGPSLGEVTSRPRASKSKWTVENAPSAWKTADARWCILEGRKALEKRVLVVGFLRERWAVVRILLRGIHRRGRIGMDGGKCMRSVEIY